MVVVKLLDREPEVVKDMVTGQKIEKKIKKLKK